MTRLFQSLLIPYQTAAQQFGLTEDELVKRVEDRELHDFLAVLLFASCGIDAGRIFTKELVARNEWPLKGRVSGNDIHQLPASRDDLLHLFKDGVIVGKVFKVKLAKGHFKDTRHGTLNDTTMDVARKDYITTAQFDGEKERNMMETILKGSTRKCENILGNYGSLRIGSDGYSLFMPCAICDLSDYMTKYHPTRRSTVDEKAPIVLAAKGLAEIFFIMR